MTVAMLAGAAAVRLLVAVLAWRWRRRLQRARADLNMLGRERVGL
jgi:hypothetical protein